MCHVSAQFMAPRNNDSSNIRDHWSLITITNTIIMKKFEMWQETPGEQMMLGKWRWSTCSQQSCHKPFTFWLPWAQTVKRLPSMQETRVQCLGWEDPLEKEMATHSSFLAWKIPWTEEPGRLQSMGSQRVRHNWATSLSLFIARKVVLWSGLYVFRMRKNVTLVVEDYNADGAQHCLLEP